MNLISLDVSRKIKILGLLLIILIVYLHASYPTSEVACKSVQRMQTAFGIFGRLGVPFFFLISGFLFFRHGSSDYGRKISKRVRTLFIPYLIATIAAYMIYLALYYLSGSHPDILRLVSEYNLDIYTSLKGEAWIRLHFIECNVNFPLWFVRDLMVLCLVSPLIYFIVKGLVRYNWLLIIYFGVALWALWYFRASYTEEQAIVFFTCGAILAVHPGFDIRKKHKTFGLICLLITAVVSVACFIPGMEFIKGNEIVVIPIGLLGLWYGYDFFVDHWRKVVQKGKLVNLRMGDILEEASAYSFFIFIFHEPLLALLRRYTLLFGNSNVFYTLCYLLMPIVIIAFLMGIGWLLRRFLPHVYSFITGNRG